MTNEQVTITLTRYRDAEGRPTCAADFRTGQRCKFYRTIRYGTRELCALCQDYLERRDDDTESLIPDEECPLWADPPSS